MKKRIFGGNMRILDIWDWKYKLLLSESTFEKVSTFIKDLKSDEKIFINQ